MNQQTNQHWILSRQQAGVRILTLNRPQQRNALSNGCLALLIERLEQAESCPQTRVIIITGSAQCFAAGADLQELRQQTPAQALLDCRPQLWRRLNAISKPLIAAVNGYALGAGFELALACDLVIAGESARFGLPEITLGMMPGAGGTQRLLRGAGKALAMQMVLTGEPINAQQARQSGLISEICLDALLLERALHLAQRIASHAPLAVRAAKAALLAAAETSLSQGLQLERQYFVSLAATEDRQEGITAFFEKRPAKFTGK